MRPSLAPAVVVGAALALAGCTGGSEPEEPGPTSSASEDGEGTDPSAEPSDGPTDEPADDEATAAGTDCVVGDWTTDPAAGADTIVGSLDLPEDPVIEVTGESYMTFAEDGTVTTTYSGVDTRMVLTLQGSTLEVRSAMDGALVGAWSATDEGTLAITDVDPSGVTMTTETTVDGEALEVPGMQEQQQAALAVGGEFRYTCDDAELRLVPQHEGADAIADFEQVLTRR
ncbi:hypothetical protein [Cellulomonas carbonis]|uniref:Lipoprotein n=1 Tax=Cellulomonas carbonis T26 TaxID=947969 RepID=A0A0A0BT84_9CELL|nr:hypothetical protein [Cellulomonas carbonis]KGM10364.1 hypothetical protein N868_15595 [Cellulomonas carbonis T26]GGC04413.1 hypothetical protein GCM10010972_16990 [Cellulomonas carbonis]